MEPEFFQSANIYRYCSPEACAGQDEAGESGPVYLVNKQVSSTSCILTVSIYYFPTVCSPLKRRDFPFPQQPYRVGKPVSTTQFRSRGGSERTATSTGLHS